MKLAMIGLGQAGGKIVDSLLAYEHSSGTNFIVTALAINTAATDLSGLEYVPDSNRLLIGQSRVKGHGVGADNELAAEIAQDNQDEILGALDDMPMSEVDGFLLVAGLGGGTGSGASPVVARQLKRIYTEPVYGLGILPASNEGGVYTLNAARSVQTLVREVDSMLLFDNDSWRETGESVEAGYAEINEEIARRFGVLFSAGEFDREVVAESVVDSSEIINTLSGGGISSIGYAAEPIDAEGQGLLDRFGVDDDDEIDSASATNRITSLVRKAVLGRLTIPCELDGIGRALVVVSGPPEYLDRKGIERSRKWIEEETGSMEVRGGDYPLPGEQKVAAVVLLAGVTSVPRIEQLQQVAVEAQESMERVQRDKEANEAQLFETDELDPLF